MDAPRRRGDPLAGLYILFMLLLVGGSAALLGAMLWPRGGSTRAGADGVWVPRTGAPAPAGEGGQALEPAGAREVAPGRFVVTMEAYNWEFRPKQIRIPLGAEVTFRGRSIQDYHGAALIGTPVVLSFPQGEFSEASHTFTERGEYLFVCSEYCGGGHASMLGSVIVE